ncbi:MAG: hypothetical protein OEV40_16950 [Acidimicrobiia bacterium]|nr:hypothetical protein [Acidimicrobiia bacterium]
MSREIDGGAPGENEPPGSASRPAEPEEHVVDDALVQVVEVVDEDHAISVGNLSEGIVGGELHNGLVTVREAADHEVLHVREVTRPDTNSEPGWSPTSLAELLVPLREQCGLPGASWAPDERDVSIIEHELTVDDAGLDVRRRFELPEGWYWPFPHSPAPRITPLVPVADVAVAKIR